jgi:hypothetical protein
MTSGPSAIGKCDRQTDRHGRAHKILFAHITVWITSKKDSMETYKAVMQIFLSNDESPNNTELFD